MKNTARKITPAEADFSLSLLKQGERAARWKAEAEAEVSRKRTAEAALLTALRAAEAAEAAAQAAWLPLRNARFAAAGVNSPRSPEEVTACDKLRTAQGRVAIALAEARAAGINA